MGPGQVGDTQLLPGGLYCGLCQVPTWGLISVHPRLKLAPPTNPWPEKNLTAAGLVSWRVEPHLLRGCYLVRECPCNQCEYKATTQSKLKIHIESVNEYPCNQCEFKATTQSRLKIHIESVHEYPFNQCEYKASIL